MGKEVKLHGEIYSLNVILKKGIKPTYISWDKGGYPLLPWLMVPHKQIWVQNPILEALYNKFESISPWL